MKYSDIVKENNPIAYTIIKNAIDNNKVPHAYLFSAPLNQEIESEYLYIIQELISEEGERNPLAYPDLSVIDGSKGLIKKDDVINAIIKLKQTALDASGVKVLVIKNIENSNKQSLNSLLKFIEEPTENTYILMTTNNISSVLSTIRSRAQVVSIKPINIDRLAKELENEGIPNEDSRLLASIYNSKTEALNEYDQDFIDLKEAIVNTMSRGLTNRDILITDLAKYIKKTNFKTSLLILRELISDIWREEQLLALSMPGERELVQKYSLGNFDFAKALESINEFIIMRNFYTNFDLSKNKLLILMGECYE